MFVSIVFIFVLLYCKGEGMEHGIAVSSFNPKIEHQFKCSWYFERKILYNIASYKQGFCEDDRFLYRVTQKKIFEDFWEILNVIFQNCFFNSKIRCISTSFKKNSILSHIGKKLQACDFLLYDLECLFLFYPFFGTCCMLCKPCHITYSWKFSYILLV